MVLNAQATRQIAVQQQALVHLVSIRGSLESPAGIYQVHSKGTWLP